MQTRDPATMIEFRGFERIAAGPLAGDDELQNSNFFTLVTNLLSDYGRWCGFIKTDRPYYYDDSVPWRASRIRCVRVPTTLILMC